MTNISQITEEQWKRYLKRLTVHAQRRFFKLGWTTKSGHRAGPQGMGPQDVSSEAILRVIKGKRKYTEQAYPDFMVFLRSVVDSLIYNMLHSVEHKKLQPLPDTANDCDNTRVCELENKELATIHNVMNKDMAEKVEAVLMRTFSNDSIVCGILECFRAGITRPSEIGEYLEVKTKDVNNAKKRLRRTIETELQKYRLECQK